MHKPIPMKFLNGRKPIIKIILSVAMVAFAHPAYGLRKPLAKAKLRSKTHQSKAVSINHNIPTIEASQDLPSTPVRSTLSKNQANTPSAKIAQPASKTKNKNQQTPAAANVLAGEAPAEPTGALGPVSFLTQLAVKTGFTPGAEDRRSSYFLFVPNVAITNSLSAFAYFEHSYLLSEYHPAFADGWEDIFVYLQHSNLYEMTGPMPLKIYANLSVQLPTSVTSQKTSLQSAPGAEVGFEIPLKYVTFTQGNEYRYAFHEYTTADVMGVKSNLRSSLLNYVSAAITFTEKISSLLYVGYYSSENYSGYQSGQVIFRGQAGYKFNKSFSGFLSVKTQEEVISNNSLFDEDNTTAMVGLSWTI